jgi:ketosteroid isomerase-like protein
MPAYPPDEVLATYRRYVDTRNRVEKGELAWDGLADFFTDDATFIDPAWGRIEGIQAIRRFLIDSMAGLEDWEFPHEWAMVDGDRLIARWQNRLPGRRADGTPYQAPGYSFLRYAGNGRFSYEEDLLNMVHVGELIRESGWKPPAAFNMPPRHPRR